MADRKFIRWYGARSARHHMAITSFPHALSLAAVNAKALGKCPSRLLLMPFLAGCTEADLLSAGPPGPRWRSLEVDVIAATMACACRFPLPTFAGSYQWGSTEHLASLPRVENQSPQATSPWRCLGSPV